MPVRALPFELYFEILFLESFSRLKRNEQKTVDKAGLSGDQGINLRLLSPFGARIFPLEDFQIRF
jgi:hypothetical protein